MERLFRTVNQMFLCELDGYIRRKRQKPSLTIERFEELFQAFLLETYYRRISEEGRPAPSSRWEEGGFLPLLVIAWGGLRGCLSIALALSVPEHLGRDLIPAATYTVGRDKRWIDGPVSEAVSRPHHGPGELMTGFIDVLSTKRR